MLISFHANSYMINCCLWGKCRAILTIQTWEWHQLSHLSLSKWINVTPYNVVPVRYPRWERKPFFLCLFFKIIMYFPFCQGITLHALIFLAAVSEGLMQYDNRNVRVTAVWWTVIVDDRYSKRKWNWMSDPPKDGRPRMKTIKICPLYKERMCGRLKGLQGLQSWALFTHLSDVYWYFPLICW